MFAKLAFRNVGRQLGNYLIYFLTVSLTVALMFAVNNAIFSKELLERASSIGELKAGLIFLSVLIALIVAFVLGYATSFMLRLRKREFGTYLTLGMTRGNILSIFVLETLILCAVSLGAGLLLGLLFYQGVMAVVANLMQMKFAFSSYSLQGLLLTVGLVCSVFVLSSLTSALYLKRVSVYNLIHGDKKVEKGVRYPGVWLAVTLISFAAIVGSCVFFASEMEKTMTAAGGSGFGMFGALAALAAAIILFHVGASKSVVNLLLKSERFKSRGTNSFTLRQLSGKLGANSLMAGALAFLIAFAVIGSNVSFVQKVSEEAILKENYPFDINVELEAGEEHAIDIASAEEIIGRYTSVKDKIRYVTYTSGKSYLHAFTRWSGEGYEELYDSFLTESDFNRIYGALGFAPIDLKGGFKIVAGGYTQMHNCDFSAAVLEFPGGPYFYKGMETDYPSLGYYYFRAVIPDAAAAGLKKESDGAAYTLGGEEFDALGLRKALSYLQTSLNGEYTYERCDYHIREYARINQNATSAVFIVSALYIAVIFVFLAMAILSLKTLSGISDDKKRYEVLYRLGADRDEQSRTLFRQIAAFFFLPFALPMLLSVPTGFICARMMKLGGYAVAASEIAAVTGGIALVVGAVYVLYFSATYLIAKRSVVKE